MSVADAQRYRTVKVFSWAAVPDDTLRDLLSAAKGTYARESDFRNLATWETEQLQHAADELFGTPPSPEREKMFVPVLLAGWLKKHAPDDAVLRAAHVAHGTQPMPKRIEGVPASRRGRVALIKDGLGRKEVRREVRRRFIGSYRIEQRKPVSQTERTVPRVVALQGEDARLLRPYPHQKEAWRALDGVFDVGAAQAPGAMLVLPTGAGKTVTALDWLFRRMEADPDPRVLWIAHQQALIDQAVLEAQMIARERSTSFLRHARAIHSAGHESGTLTDAKTSFAAITWQTLTRMHKARLNSYFKRPVFVVVDEAHHAGADSFHEMLNRVGRYANCRGLLGLSATPVPVQARAAKRVRQHFPQRPYEITLGELIDQGILARPVFSTVRTHVPVDLDDEASEALRKRKEIPTETLLDLADSEERNKRIVDEYCRDAQQWAKTLIFCIDIAMADAIAQQLDERGVEHVRALHSDLPDGSRAPILQWFREAPETAVLVAVGMLNEGVDLPDAKTAFLARPTKNRILIKQMVGRVLRGTPAGGSAEANVVDFRDDWPSLARILGPESYDDGGFRGDGGPIRSDELPAAFLNALELLFADKWPPEPEPQQENGTKPPAPEPLVEVSRLTNLALAGAWRLDNPDVPIVPVLEHQGASFESFAARARTSGRMRSLEQFFRDLPEPRPPVEHLQALRDALVADAATYHSVHGGLGAGLAVERIRQAGVTDSDEQLRIIREIHATTAARIVEPSINKFIEQVRRMLDARTGWRDDKLGISPPDVPKIDLWPLKDRQLRPILDAVAAQGRAYLTYEVRGRLQVPPPLDIDWTPRVIDFAFGYHSFDPRTGRQFIRINRLLCTSPDAVSDELLSFLVWHELLHHVLLKSGHDAQFMDFEQAWPNAAELDGQLATFHERFNTDSKAYGDS